MVQRRRFTNGDSDPTNHSGDVNIYSDSAEISIHFAPESRIHIPGIDIHINRNGLFTSTGICIIGGQILPVRFQNPTAVQFLGHCLFAGEFLPR